MNHKGTKITKFGLRDQLLDVRLRGEQLEAVVGIHNNAVAILNIATTGMANQDRDGIPLFQLSQEIEREAEQAKQRGN